MRPQTLHPGAVVAVVPLSELQELHAMARELFEQVNALAFPPDDAPVTDMLRRTATRTAGRVLGRLGALPQHVHSIPPTDAGDGEQTMNTEPNNGPFAKPGIPGGPLPAPARVMNEAWRSSVQRNPLVETGVVDAFAAGVEAGMRLARSNPFATTEKQA